MPFILYWLIRYLIYAKFITITSSQITYKSVFSKTHKISISDVKKIILLDRRKKRIFSPRYLIIIITDYRIYKITIYIYKFDILKEELLKIIDREKIEMDSNNLLK